MDLKIYKFIRYAAIYGFRRALAKAVGRSNFSWPLVYWSSGISDIGLVGCGQYGLTTVGYFIAKNFGRRFRICFDVDDIAAERASVVLGASRFTVDFDDVIKDNGVNWIYICSSHSTHTPYAVKSLEAGKNVYIEKPVCVDWTQYSQIMSAVKMAGEGKVRCGYNRPHSRALKLLDKVLLDHSDGLSLSCFVSGHLIPADHWYRNSGEGTRIAGNAGHWIDLFVHLLSRRRALPKEFRLSLTTADESARDDNFALAITTDYGDLFSLVLTARSEPIEGINETINLQWGGVIAKIDDFRSLEVWTKTKRSKFKFWPKDAGHEEAITQLGRESVRPWSEVDVSTQLMLYCVDLVRSGGRHITLKCSSEEDLRYMRVV